MLKEVQDQIGIEIKLIEQEETDQGMTHLGPDHMDQGEIDLIE